MPVIGCDERGKLHT